MISSLLLVRQYERGKERESKLRTLIEEAAIVDSSPASSYPWLPDNQPSPPEENVWKQQEFSSGVAFDSPSNWREMPTHKRDQLIGLGRQVMEPVIALPSMIPVACFEPSESLGYHGAKIKVSLSRIDTASQAAMLERAEELCDSGLAYNQSQFDEVSKRLGVLAKVDAFSVEKVGNYQAYRMSTSLRFSDGDERCMVAFIFPFEVLELKVIGECSREHFSIVSRLAEKVAASIKADESAMRAAIER